MTGARTGWRKVRFDQMASVVTERVEPAEVTVDRYVGLEHLDPETLTIERWGHPSEVIGTKYRVRPGQIIFGKRRFYQRKVAVAPFDCICSAHAMVLEERNDTVAEGFLPHFMLSEVFVERALAISEGSLSPTIKWKRLAEQEFTLPPLDRQREIAGLLGGAERAIEAARLARVAAVRGNRSLVGRLLARHRGYPERSVAEVSDLISVGVVVRPASYYVNDGVPMLRSFNVLPGYIDTAKLVYCSSEANDGPLAKSRLAAGDVVVVRSGVPGTAAVIPDRLDGVNCVDLIFVRPRADVCRSEYLSHFMNSPNGRAQVLARQAGLAQQHLNARALGCIRLPVPPLQVQDSIVAQINNSVDLTRGLEDHGAVLRRVREAARHAVLGVEDGK